MSAIDSPELQSVSLSISKWHAPILAHNADDNLVLYTGRNRGYLIDAEPQFIDATSYFDYGSIGALGRLTLAISSAFGGFIWWKINFSWAIDCFFLTALLTRFVFGRFWVARFEKKYASSLIPVHCNIQTGPFFKNVSKSWASLLLALAAISVSGMFFGLKKLLNQPSIEGVIFVLFLAWITWFLGAGPLQALTQGTKDTKS